MRNKLGQYLAEAGQTGRAIALLEHDAGDDPDALVALGNAYQLAGRHPDALRAFRRIVEVDPNSGLGYENIGIAQLQDRQLAAAESALRKAIALDPTLGGAHTALGVVLASTGRKPEAIDTWKRALALDASDLERPLQHHAQSRRSRTTRRGADLRRTLHRGGAGGDAGRCRRGAEGDSIDSQRLPGCVSRRGRWTMTPCRCRPQGRTA